MLSAIARTGLNFHAVFVEQPWPSDVFIPQGSSESVVVNCTANTSEKPEWSITLPGASTASQFSLADSIALLNGENFYNMTVIQTEQTKTIRLHINNTEGKNGTKIQCINPGTAGVIDETTLIG